MNSDSASIVGTAPEVLMAAVAATTQRIRVGSAGVMLPHYSTLKVAEQFRVLEAIAPGRIDLGVGRAPGSDRATAMALNPDLHAAERFPVQVQELDLWLRGEPFPEGHPYRGIRALPQGPTTPQVWILGSSDYGAQLAAQLPVLVPQPSQLPVTPALVAREASTWRVIASISLARSAARQGAEPTPQLPITAVVTPCQADGARWESHTACPS